MKIQVLENLRSKFGFWIGLNWPKIGKITIPSQFSDMTSSSILFDMIFFLLSSLATGLSFMAL